MASKLGDTLRRLMGEKGVSSADLAKAGGIDESTMGQILRGEITRPPDRRLRGFAERLGVSFQHLLDLIPEARRAEAAFDRAAGAAEFIAADPPEWVQLMPLGEIVPRDSRAPWRLGDPEKVIAASMDDLGALPIDFDHQTDNAARTGQAAPAAGWIRELAARADGIWGRVEWTERGRAAVAAKEWRFISPAFLFDRGRAITRILRAGLTNNPAFNLKALAASEASSEEENMNEFLKKLRGLLGLAETADETAVAAAIESAIAAKAAGLAPVATALGLADGATADELATAAAALKVKAEGEPDPKRYVKAEEYNALATRIGELEGKHAKDKSAAAVDAAIESGKLVPAQREWALGYAAKDPEAFAAFAAAQPVIVGKGATVKPAPAKAGGALSEDELALCHAMGLSEEDFKKTRDAEMKGEAA